jgi:hypothetical protein
MLEYINGWEWLLIGFLIFAAIVMIALIEEDGMPLVGLIVMAMVFVLAHDIHASNLDKAFVLKSFHEGQALKCGGFWGESTLVDSHNEWKYTHAVGFIKGDQIRNDLGMCCVIGKDTPQPSIVPYAFAFFTLTFIAFLLRHAIERKEMEEDQEETREKPHE